MVKCPLHNIAVVGGKCPICQMTPEQAKARSNKPEPPKADSASSSAATPPKTPPTAPEVVKTLEERVVLLEERCRQSEARLKLVETREADSNDKLVAFGRDLDKIDGTLEVMSRSVNAVQSLALLHSQEMGAIERLLGYMHIEREYIAQALGLKSPEEMRAWIEAHRAKNDATPPPSGPIAPEDKAPQAEHDETPPVDT